MVGLHYREDPRRKAGGDEHLQREVAKEAEDQQSSKGSLVKETGTEDNNVALEPSAPPVASTMETAPSQAEVSPAMMSSSNVQELQAQLQARNDDVKRLQDYSVGITKNNAELAKQKANAIKEKAEYHGRYKDIIAQNASLNASHSKRVKEKDVVVQENVYLSEANADLRSENAELVADKYLKDRRIEELEKEVEALSTSRQNDATEIARLQAEPDQAQRGNDSRKRTLSHNPGKHSPDQYDQRHVKDWEQSSDSGTNSYAGEDSGRRERPYGKKTRWSRDEREDPETYEQAQHSIVSPTHPNSYNPDSQNRNGANRHRHEPRNQNDPDWDRSGSYPQNASSDGGQGVETLRRESWSWNRYPPHRDARHPSKRSGTYPYAKQPPTAPRAHRDPSV